MAEHESSMFREELLKLARCWAGYEPVPGKKPYSEDSCRPIGSGKKKNKKDDNKKSEKKSAAPFQNALLDAQVPAYKERVSRAAELMNKLMGKGKNKSAPGGSSVVKAGASTPAWQRSEGKNDEGGLNAKGRASYNKATGGHLKAPVTESNPKGKRAKRQNSFCSRMCGMKRVNTGASTAKDPDSRINKSLRKWNCKCSSAMLFGALAAGEEKQANPVTVARGGWNLVQNALRASGRGAASAASTGARVMRRAPPPMPVPFGMTGAAKAVERSKIMDLVGKHMGQIGSQADEAVQAIHGGLRNATGAGADAARYVADHTSRNIRSIGQMAEAAGFNPERFSDVSKFFTTNGSRIRELITNAIGAQRMAEGTLKVPAIPFLTR